MRTDRLRSIFAEFLNESKIGAHLNPDGCITIEQDTCLKYERIEKYSVDLLNEKDLRKLLAFCRKHGINLWFGFGRLCVGFNSMMNMRLSAYSVHKAPEISGILENGIEHVAEISQEVQS